MDVKIAFMINAFTRGGAEKVLSVILNELCKNNNQIELILLEQDNTFLYTIPENCKVTYLSTSQKKYNNLIKFFMIPYFALKLKQYIEKENISLIQSHVYRANYVNVLSKLFGALHTVQVVNAGQASRYLDKGLLGKINLFLIEYLYAKADLIIYKAIGMQKDMRTLFLFSNKQIVINNPYDIQRIQELATEPVSDFIFDTNKVYLISVGRLIPLKRNEDTLRTLSQLPSHVELIFLGEGSEQKNLSDLAQKLEIENRIHFMGRVSNPYKYIFHSNIFVSASQSEGFPNVLVESMICGIPVVSSDCVSGPREILAPETDIGFQLKSDFELGEYGILFPVGNVDSLTKAILSLIQDKDLNRQYIEKAKQRAESFSVEKIVNQYKKALEL